MTPDKYTIEERMVKVGDGHELYVQLWGNKTAKQTIIFLHGGPGSGCDDKHKTLFDPAKQRVIFFDQRGCGKSTPYGSLVNNDTDRLVEDINKLAAEFKVKSFTLTGGSWGSCLALVYAVRNPKRVERLVLRGIFTGRKNEIEFVEKGRFKATFPDVWVRFVETVPAKYAAEPSKYHIPFMLGSDPVAAKKSAFAYDQLESAISSFDDRQATSPAEVFEDFDPVPITIECHYLVNKCFLPESYILKNAKKLTMPVDLVQGRYDMVCPPFTAYELAQKLPRGRLIWTVAGHSGNDRANWDMVRTLLREPALV